MSKKGMAHIVGLIIILIFSIPCGFLVFRYFGWPAFFLPISIILMVCFALLGDKMGLKLLVPISVVKKLRLLMFAYCLGMFVFAPLCWLMAYFNFNFFSETIRFPMSEVEWISVNNDGEIYCLSFSYSRIQVFDSDGQFSKGWFVRKPRGSYQVSLTKDGRVVLGNQDGKPLYCYDSYGNRKSLPEEGEVVFTPMRTRKTVDENGNTYELRNELLRPYIAKIHKNGSEEQIIKDPLGLWIHTYPIPFFAFIVLTVAVYFCVPIVSLAKFK